MAAIGFAVMQMSEDTYQYCRLFAAEDGKMPEPMVPGKTYGNAGEAASCPEALKIIRRESGVFEFAIASAAGAFAEKLLAVADAVGAFDPEIAGSDTERFEIIQVRMAEMEAKGDELTVLLAG